MSIATEWVSMVAAEIKREIKAGRLDSWAAVKRWAEESCAGTELVIYPVKARALLQEEGLSVQATAEDTAQTILYEQLIDRARELWEEYRSE